MCFMIGCPQHDVELLLLAVQHCGFQLRSDDAERLKVLIGTIEAKALAAGSGGLSARMEVGSGFG